MKELLSKLEAIFTAVAFTEAGELEKARQYFADLISLSPEYAPAREGDS